MRYAKTTERFYKIIQKKKEHRVWVILKENISIIDLVLCFLLA